jgi:hypothetical protein
MASRVFPSTFVYRLPGELALELFGSCYDGEMYQVFVGDAVHWVEVAPDKAIRCRTHDAECAGSRIVRSRIIVPPASAETGGTQSDVVDLASRRSLRQA